jgi:WG containing repeat
LPSYLVDKSRATLFHQAVPGTVSWSGISTQRVGPSSRRRFEDAGDFAEGLAPAGMGGFYGFIDQTGKWVTEPRFRTVSRFHQGLAAAEGKNETGFGYINRTDN